MTKGRLLEQEKLLELFYPNGINKPYNKNKLKDVSLVNELINLTIYLDDTVSFSERLYCLKNNTKPQLCECSNKTKFKSSKSGYAEFCSRKCMNQSKKVKDKRKKTTIETCGGLGFASDKISGKVSETNLKRYGVSNATQSKQIAEKISESWKKLDRTAIIEKRKKTNLEKYGTEYHQQNSEQKTKINNTLIEKYGGSGFASESIKAKIHDTNLKKYGFVNPMMNLDVQAKMKSTMMVRHGVDNISEVGNEKWNTFKTNFDPINFKLTKSLQEMEEEYGVRYYTISNFLKPYGYEFSNISSYEQSLRNFLPADFEYNNRIILSGKELDFYSSKRNIAIEFNGLLYHSEKYGKDKNYHFDKTNICIAKGIQLIHIFENDWLKNSSVIKSILNRKLCKINVLDIDECYTSLIPPEKVNIFLEENNLFGSSNSALNIGLVHCNKLVAVMSFSEQNDVFKLDRFCLKNNINLVGGFEKLWKHFLSNYKPQKVETILDRRYFSGETFIKNGFKQTCTKFPNRYRLSGNKLNLDNSKSINVNYVWDSGQDIYQWCKSNL